MLPSQSPLTSDRLSPGAQEQFDGGAFDVSQLTFEQCHVRVDFNATPARVVGVDLRAPRSAAITFDGCRFDGRAAAMILAWSGQFDVLQCSFDNGQAPDESVEQGTIANGVDIFIGAPVLEQKADGMVLPAVASSVRAAQCSSRSHQFVGTFSSHVDDRIRRRSLLLACRHGNFYRPVPDATPIRSRPPSVFWGDAGPLDLVGCSIRVLAGSGEWPIQNIASATGPVTIREPRRYTVAMTVRVDADSSHVEADSTVWESPVRDRSA